MTPQPLIWKDGTWYQWDRYGYVPAGEIVSGVFKTTPSDTSYPFPSGTGGPIWPPGWELPSGSPSP